MLFRSRVFVAGDAAHMQPPFLGQGMCQGVRDVANLAWKLTAVLRGEAPEAWLDSYGIERQAHVLRTPPDGAVHRARIDVSIAEFTSDAPRHRALPGTRRTINRNHQSLHVAHVCASVSPPSRRPRSPAGH